MVEQHPIKFAEYTELTKHLGTTSANLRKFFEQATVDAFFEKRSMIVCVKGVFAVNKSIVEVIVQEFVFPAARGDDDDDNDDGLVDWEDELAASASALAMMSTTESKNASA